ncbi:MAG: InlB B-repeat-containing protein, partial [Ruminococcus sp.]|nr:InlB B-repeat-containing protein [Ruminococcus sp.]
TGEIDVTFKYDIATNSYYSDDTDYVEKFIVTSNDGVSVNSTDVTVSLSSSVGLNNVFGHYTSHYVLAPDTENYDIESPVTYTLTPDLKADGTADGTYTLSIALSDAEKVEISVDGTKVADKAIGSTFTQEITPPDGQYLSGVTTTPDVNASITDNTVTFKVPETNVNIDPEFTDYSYVEFTDTTGLTITGLKGGYKAGEKVEITVAPASEQVTISNIVADNDAAVIVDNGNDWTITIDAMPAETYITITPTVDAKFIMDYGMTAIGNFGTGVTTGFGTVSMKIGDTALAKGGYADKTEAVTYTATESNANYTFAGFYSDADCKNVLTYENTYTVTPTKDTTVYTLWARRQYMDFDSGTANIVKELVYDKEERVYTLSTVLADKSSENAISKSAWFQVTNDKNSWTADPSYHHFGSDFSVSHNGCAFDATISWNDGGDSWKLSTSAANDTAIKFILTPTGNTAIDFSAQVGEVGDLVYLSSGRLDLPGSYVAADFEANIKFTHIEESANPTDTYVANEGENREKYKRLSLDEAQTVSFEVQITGNRAADYEVDTFVVYHINTESYTLVSPETKGNNTYAGSVFVDGDAYIVPVYFLTEEYAEKNNLAEIDIYFDATAIKDQAWGPFVACYAWGTNGAEYNGGWSGQMMIPSEDGLSFYTMITVPKATAENPPSVPQGVTFNNYLQSTVPGSNAGTFGITSTQYQCYDYREPITLYELGYEVITFVAKDSTDGYHGDHANGVTSNPISKDVDIFEKYDFEYLYSRDGVTPMDLTGQEILNAPELSDTNKADYYVVNEGDLRYYKDKHGYQGDPSYEGKWTVEWWVFDSEGNYKTNIISDAFYNDIANGDGTTYLQNALGLTKEQAAGKSIAISYEHENNYSVDGATHQISYDGQWYGNMLDHTVTGNVLVGLLGEDNNTYEIDDDNVADYGEGYLVDENGDKHASLEITMDLGEASLSAVRKDGYRFIGWHTRQPNGTYKLISNAYDYTTYINNNTTYYAIFKQIQSGEVVINHAVYKNTDPAIPDHGGVSEMSIEVYNKNGLLVSSTPSTSRSTTSFEGTDGETYTIKVITKPLMNGQFFAWYTDSENSDGTKTYEEILTDPNAIGKTETVSAEFEYTFDNSTSLKNINIYSDVRRVSNKANLYYKYRNRYGDIKTYTVKDYVLTDDECGGYVGNKGIEYCPTFLTWCEGKDPEGNDFGFYLHPDRIAEYQEKGYDILETYNLIDALAPKADVTEAFGQEIKWLVTEVNLTTASSEIILVATQDDLKYTINYDMPGDSNSITKYYNELVEIDAPATDAYGKNFSYWYEPATDEILTYNRFYNYRVVENKTIVAVYDADILEDWTPSVNSVTYTREFDDNGDYIYTDFLLAYNNVNGAKVADLIAEGKDINYGYFLVRNPADVITTSAEVSDPKKYPAVDKYSADWKDGLQSVIDNNKSNAITVGGKDYNCYFYNLTGRELTNFNRCDAFIRYDNTKLDKQNVLYRQYAFTAVAYIVVEGELYLSNGLNVNFFDLGNEETTKN